MTYGPEGTIQRKYCVIAEAPAKEEMRGGRPLIGPAGQLFDRLCSEAGISRREMYLTNVVDHQIENVKPLLQGGRLTALGLEHAERLYDELWNAQANVFIPMGNLALCTLTGLVNITKYRGSILKGRIWRDGEVREIKCVPTIHPAACFKGQYLWTYLIRDDLKRAKREVEFPEIRRPLYNLRLDPPFEECMAYLKGLHDYPAVSFDIEIAGGEVSRLGFATSPLDGISIGLSYYSIEEEGKLLLATAEVLGNPEIAKIGQNLMFDITFMLRKCSIITRGRILDTMYAQHIVYPDFKKDLGTLCSLYTDQPYYKNMVKHGDIEKEEG